MTNVEIHECGCTSEFETCEPLHRCPEHQLEDEAEAPRPLAPFGLLERIVICYRYNWQWRNFWRGWGDELALTGEFIIAGMLLVCVLCRQIILLPLFPLWRLIGEPVKVALRCTDDHAKNLKTILGI